MEAEDRRQRERLGFLCTADGKEGKVEKRVSLYAMGEEEQRKRRGQGRRAYKQREGLSSTSSTHELTLPSLPHPSSPITREGGRTASTIGALPVLICSLARLRSVPAR